MGLTRDNDRGSIRFSEETVKTIAGLAAMESPGIVGMAAGSLGEGLADILGREDLSRGINTRVQDDALVIEMRVIVGFGVNIPEVARNAMQRVRYAVETNTGFKVHDVVMKVEGVRPRKGATQD